MEMAKTDGGGWESSQWRVALKLSRTLIRGDWPHETRPGTEIETETDTLSRPARCELHMDDRGGRQGRRRDKTPAK